MSSLYLAGAWLAFLPETYGFALNWAMLYVFTAIIVAIFVRRSWRERPIVDWAAAFALALAGWAALSLAWSADWRTGLAGVANMAACFALFCWARRNAAKVARATLIASIGACVLVFAIPNSHGGFGNPNFLAEFLIIAAPFLLISKIGRVAALGVGAVIVFKVDALIGAAAAGTWTPEFSIVYRLELWAGTALMWADAFLLGQGLGSFDYLFSLYAPDTTVLSEPYKSAGAAHSDPLQLLAELGLVGLVLAVFLVRQAWRKPRTSIERAAAASLVLAGLLSLIGFPLQNPATAALVAASLGIATARAGAFRVVFDRRHRAALASCAIAGAVAMVGIGVSAIVGQVNYAVAHNAYRSDPFTTYAALKAANAADPFERRYRANLFPAAVAAIDKITSQEIDFAETASSTAMPHSSQFLILRAAGLIDCCPNEAGVLISDLERRHIGGHTVPDLRRMLTQRMGQKP